MSYSMTPRQADLLAALRRRAVANPDVLPSFSELCEELGLRSKSSIARLLDGLERRGAIRRMAKHSRSIELLDPSVGAGGVERALDIFCKQTGRARAEVVSAALTEYFRSHTMEARDAG